MKAIQIKYLLFCLLLLCGPNTVAQTDMFNESVPLQEFVTSEPEPNPQLNATAAESAGELVNEANKRALENPSPFAQNPVLPPASAPFENMEGNAVFGEPSPEGHEPAVTTVEEDIPTNARTPTALTSAPLEEDQNNDNTATTADFAGGLNEDMFTKCAILTTGVCSKATTTENFQKCLLRLKQQPACEQFMTFAAMSSFGPNDDVDLVQYYPEGQLTLIHVVRMGQNYPGDYYTIGADGSFLSITAGAEVRKITITQDLRYPQIIARYPKAQIWSVVEQLPMASASPDGGLRLIFRFALLNGCVTCDKAGYANVAYDFSGSGTLQAVSLLSLDPILAQQ